MSSCTFELVLFSNRKREQERIRREAAGESLWTSAVPKNVRVKITYALFDAVTSPDFQRLALEVAHGVLARDYGQTNFSGRTSKSDDLIGYFRSCPDENVPDVVEALFEGLRQADRKDEYRLGFVKVAQFVTTLNEILATERISYEFVEGRMVEFESREMHEEVIVPTLTLLAGLSEWQEVERAYQNALSEIPRDPADAITDAASALELALRLRHCDGNSLGELGRSGASRRVLTPYDLKLIDWVNADRAGRGDAHGSPETPAQDAWLTVHVVGALILRLASGTQR